MIWLITDALTPAVVHTALAARATLHAVVVFTLPVLLAGGCAVHRTVQSDDRLVVWPCAADTVHQPVGITSQEEPSDETL